MNLRMMNKMLLGTKRAKPLVSRRARRPGTMVAHRHANSSCITHNACSCSAVPTINQVANGDPTRTTTLRNSFAADAVRRYRAISKALYSLVVDDDIFGLEEPKRVTSLTASPATIGHDARCNAPGLFSTNAVRPAKRAFAFQTDAQKVNGFMDWLHASVNEGVLDILPGDPRGASGNVPWANVYIDSAYKKGMRRAAVELENAGLLDATKAVAKDRAVNAAFAAPVNADRVAILYTRNYQDLRGVSDDLDKVTSRRLAQGLMGSALSASS